jgi:hypothetical protein
MKYLRISAGYRRTIIIFIIILPVLLMIVSHHQPGAGTLQNPMVDQPAEIDTPGLADLFLKR